MQFSDLKVGKTLVMKSHPCRIVEVDRSAPGRHGHAKKRVVGIDLMTGQKFEQTFTHSDHPTPVVIRRPEYEVIDIDRDGFVSMMTDEGVIREDFQLPESNRSRLERALDDGAPPTLVMLRIHYRLGDEDREVERLERLKK